ncbi:MAG: (2Fe-2S) ferredoxin domain-containing protein [Magnetospiraceae bacterium]
MPKPEKHVFVCTQSRPPGHPRGSCSAHNCAEVFEEFLAQWQSRNLFESVLVTSTGCMGPCSLGPSVLVYPEGVMYGGVTKADVTEIFEQHLVGDKPVDRLRVPAEVWG